MNGEGLDRRAILCTHISYLLAKTFIGIKINFTNLFKKFTESLNRHEYYFVYNEGDI